MAVATIRYDEYNSRIDILKLALQLQFLSSPPFPPPSPTKIKEKTGKTLGSVSNSFPLLLDEWVMNNQIYGGMDGDAIWAGRDDDLIYGTANDALFKLTIGKTDR